MQINARNILGDELVREFFVRSWDEGSPEVFSRFHLFIFSNLKNPGKPVLIEAALTICGRGDRSIVGFLLLFLKDRMLRCVSIAGPCGGGRTTIQSLC